MLAVRKSGNVLPPVDRLDRDVFVGFGNQKLVEIGTLEQLYRSFMPLLVGVFGKFFEES